MDLTAQNEHGVEIYKSQRIYMSQCTDSLGPVMVLGPDRKLGIIRDTTFQPFKPKREEFEINLSKPATSLNIRIKLKYQLRPGDDIIIHNWHKKIETSGLFKEK